MVCQLCNKEIKSIGRHISHYHHNITVKEYYDRFLKKGDEGICPECGKPTRFLNTTKGYCTFCSNECLTKSNYRKEKTKETNLKKFGVESYTQTQEYKDKINTINSNKSQQEKQERLDKIKNTMLGRYGVDNYAKLNECKDKIKQTNLDKYGVEYYSQSSEFIDKLHETSNERYNKDSYSQTEVFKQKYRQTSLNKYNTEHLLQSKEIIEKRKQTIISKYGVDNYSKTDEYLEKTRKTSLKKYGVNNYNQTQECKDKIEQTKKQHYLENHQNFIDIKENSYILKCYDRDCNLCSEKQFEISKYLYFKRKETNIELCTIKKPVGKNSKDTNIELFIRNILNEYNIEYITNTRYILSNHRELDIYIPKHKIAIEINGIIWHSTLYEYNIRKHLEKYEECKKLGIQLLTIWEDQIIHKPNIIKSLILSKLGIYSDRIYARKCIIKEVSSNDTKTFLNDNHLQGYSPSTYKYGLYYNDELVSLMTFSKKSNYYDNTRFCNKLNTQVIGGASKLLKHFIKTIKPNKIVTFASKDISNGNLYTNLNFQYVYDIAPTYWYIEKKTLIRKHKSNFRKKYLINKGYGNIEQTESEIMSTLPYYKIYDCGHIKYELDNCC